MMDTELNVWLLFEHAAQHHGDDEIVTRVAATGETHRTNYREFSARAQQLMGALDALGLERGVPVATLAWNSYRHLECYFGIPCTARVMHTLNLRLSPHDLGYIINHAGDRAILVDPDLIPLLEQVDDLSKVEHIIVIGDEVPETTLRNVVAYEDLLADQPTTYGRFEIPEKTPLGLCYTSGTTGMPKGAQYTHRSTYLHSLIASSGAGLSIGPSDVMLPIVPMFHANAWGVPYACTAVGAKQVFASGSLDPAGIVDLLVEERVTIASAVPTIWLTVADELARRGQKLTDLRHIISGGSQPPRALIKRYLEEFGVPIVQAWGMTETSPLATVAWPKARMRDWDLDTMLDAVRSQAGLPVPGIDLSIRGEDGVEVPWDGETMGDLYVRGPWVIDSYLHGDGAECFTDDGWFRTGDVAIGSPSGYMVIADRTKDLIKSGGEWISSVEMEAAIMAMPGVAEAAVIAIPDPKWQERPLACVALRAGATLEVGEVRDHLEKSGFAKWQLPDRIQLIDEVPKTSVGKFDKKALRARLAAS
jgi:fatty-acyl-CoA synthase